MLQSGAATWFALLRPLGVRGHVLAAVLTSIVVMLAFAAALTLHHAGMEKQAIGYRVQSAARSMAHAVDLEIAAAQSLLSGLSTSPSIQKGDLRAFHEQLTIAARPMGSRFMLFDMDGAQLINTKYPFGTELPGATAALRANLEAIRSGQTRVSDLKLGRAADDHVIGVGFPVRRGDTIDYALSMLLPTGSLSTVFDQIPLDLTGTVLDGTGAVIASNRPGREVGRPLNIDLARIRAADSHELIPYTDSDGSPAIAAVARSTVSPWTVMTELPQSHLRAPLRDAMLLIAGSAAIFLVAGVALAPFASRRIVALFDRLRQIADAATREKDDLQALYRTHFNNTTEGLFVVEVTADGGFLFEALNPAHELLTGLRTEIVRGKAPDECLSADVAAWVTGNYRRCVEEGAPIRYDEVLALPGGTRAWETSLVPVRDPVSGRICRIIGSARDVSDRRAMFEALRESEARFRAVADTVPDILYVSDPQARCAYVNARFYEYTGLPQGALTGKGWMDAIHPRDLPSVLASMRRSGAREATFECEFRMRAADGSYRWFVGRSRAIRDQEGRIARWFGTAADVDDLKRAQAALESVNRRLCTILSSISDAYYAVDREWRFIDVNPQAASWVGMTPDMMMGRAVTDLFPDSTVIAHIRRVVSTGVPYHLELPSIFKPGRWIDLHVYPSSDGASVFFRDVTRRKLAELSALATQDLLQSTMDALSAHIAILDAKGVIITVNAAWRRFAELSRMQPENAGVGSNYLDICGTAGPACADANVVTTGLRAIMRGEHTEFRLEYPCPCGGEPRWFQLRATRFGEGETMRMVLAHENITEIMQAEQALRRLAGRLLRTQDEERRRIARDLHDSTAQNLLGATLGIERALRLSPHLPERAKTALADAQALIEHSQQEIRTVSYLLHPPMLDEMGLPSALRWYAEGFTKRSGIAVQIAVSKLIEGRRFPFDVEAALFRVLQECLTNVHRHSGSKTAHIDFALDVVSGVERLVLRVEDHGKGMMVAARRRDLPDRKRDPSGIVSVGVGLPGMRERLRQLGGSLEIWSSPRGTTVRATVPIRAAAEEAAKPELAPAAGA
jgi:PAS domain S-box-containing protein